MQVIAMRIPAVKLIRPVRHGDDRGNFWEPYNRQRFFDAGIQEEFVQDNQSLSLLRGTVRGLHFQAPPHVQAKLVWCITGAILDVVLDVRRGAPTFGRHVAMRIKADGDQLFVPEGFAHGYCTLEPDTRIAYKVTDFYVPESEGGVLWSDPALRIEWPDFASAGVSAKDAGLPRFGEFVSPFLYRE